MNAPETNAAPDLSADQIVEAVRNGVRVRWVPRNVSGIAPEDYDDDGQERDLFIGTRRASDEESMIVADLSRGRSSPLRCVESGRIGVYEIR